MIRREYNQPCTRCGTHKYMHRCYSCRRWYCYNCDVGVWCRACRDRRNAQLLLPWPTTTKAQKGEEQSA